MLPRNHYEGASEKIITTKYTQERGETLSFYLKLLNFLSLTILLPLGRSGGAPFLYLLYIVVKAED